MSFDIVIPTYTISDRLEEMAVRCVNSYKGHGGRVMVFEDGGRRSPALEALADVYTYYPDNVGFTKNVNRGWRYSDADYTMIVSSDTHLLNGKLEDLCVPGRVTSPHIVTQEVPYLAGCFFCVPRDLTEKYGYLLEGMVTYCSDSEYDHRVRGVFQKVPAVEIIHLKAQTVTAAGVEGGENMTRDRETYAKLIKKGDAAC
jgi:glycosyltransferase involved in cell wall biosynthesis